MRPKQLVIDKSTFQGIDVRSLCSFASGHSVLVSDTLLYECVTDEQMLGKVLLSRCQSLIKAGAYYCSCSVTFLQYEAKHLQPYPWWLPDLEKTSRIREGRVRMEGSFGPQELEEIFGARSQLAVRILLETVDRVRPRIQSKRPELPGQIKRLPTDTRARMVLWLEHFDRIGMHDLAVRSMPDGWLGCPDRFCRSNGWISWDYFRLLSVLVNDYYYLQQTGGSPGTERAEHDYQDMEYVLLLARADALLTRDKRMVEPLARAAFPDKDVFSSLDEVPDSYKCGWG